MESSFALRTFQALTVIASALFFTIATIATWCSRTQEAKARDLRNVQFGLTCVETLLCWAEAAVNLEKSDPHEISDPDAVYALFLSLIWLAVSLSLTATPEIPPYPHLGTYAILFVCQGMVLVLSPRLTPSRDEQLITRSLLQQLQFTVEACLLGSFLLGRKEIIGNTGEVRPLLSHESTSDDIQEADKEEAQRRRIRNRPFWEYLASFKVFVPYMYPRSPKLRLYFGGMCITSALTRVVKIALPLSQGMIVNGLRQGIPYKAIVLYAVLGWLSYVFQAIEGWFSGRVTTDLMLALQRHCYDHIMGLSADFHDSKTSSITLKTTDRGKAVIDLLHDIVFQSLPTLIDLVSAVVTLTYLFGFYMGFMIAFTVVLFTWLAFKALAEKRPILRSCEDAYDAQYNQMCKSVSNWQMISYFRAIPYETQKYGEKVDISRKQMFRWYSYERLTWALRHLVHSISLVAVCIIVALQIERQQRGIADLVAFFTYWPRLTRSLAILISESSTVAGKLASAENLVALLEEKPRIEDSEGAEDFKFKGGAVDFKEVCFSYDGTRQVVKSLTFHVEPGQTVAFVGETGSGKSTLLKLLFRFYDVQSGSILIDGQDIRAVRMDTFREEIAVVPQNPPVFTGSVLGNVKYPGMDRTDEEVMDACDRAALHDKIMSLTHGYSQKVGEGGATLSNGEVQRLAIARVFLRDPGIVFLDEATSSVDNITEEKIKHSMRKFCQGRTTFIIAHRLSTVLDADLILVIQGGQILESGKHGDLLKLDGLYKKLWDSQVGIQSTPQRQEEDTIEENADA
ncbi:uncharacterized protein PV07_12711 [Cladophialophora immunda]|uniref:ABC transporter domain-containing protein n=1 Tax=Cladophialophora immunda TaxID=569365 RepID=A0A0D2BS42_9EURO|nr:uncharacterized protein PV07_12711 [Cladophialophora immunda]KIW21878.1 hypothetical protein PV07_12711 [Cladophialophora immunda]